MEEKTLIEKISALDANLGQEVTQLLESYKVQRDTLSHQLHLLERAISTDYDSIVITELDLDFPGPRIVYANEGFSRLTGYALEEVIGKTPRILQGPKTDRATLDRLKKNLIEGQSFFGQTVNYRKDGSEFVNQWDIHPLEDENGKITHWVSYQHDVTERKNAEINMGFDPSTDFDKLDELGKSIIIDFDEQANVLYANKAFREMSGYQVDKLKTLKAWDFLQDEEKGIFSNDFFDQKDDKIENQNILLKKPSGQQISVKAETQWMKIDGQDVLRAKITNLNLQNRVMDAITRIRQVAKNAGESNPLLPYRIRLSIHEHDFLVESVSKSTESSFDIYGQGTSITECEIGPIKGETLKKWASTAAKDSSICEYFSHNGTDYTMYIKKIDAHTLVLMVTTNESVKV